ncbi:MAG: hypothetical protein N2645_03605 [Clostridia bacterium]|nr:hypothetical protein [Clostridia bacterium]
MFGQRRPYRPIRQPVKPEPAAIQNVDAENLKSVMLDSLRAVSKNIEELKQSIHEVNRKFEDLSSRQKKTETLMDVYKIFSGMSENSLTEIKKELEFLKKSRENSIVDPGLLQYNFQTAGAVEEAVENRPDNQFETVSPKQKDKPMMPGIGFASVTKDYLRNLQKKDGSNGY